MQDRCDDLSASLSGACSRSRSGSGEGTARIDTLQASDKAESAKPEEESNSEGHSVPRDTRQNFEPDSTLSSIASRVFIDVLSACAIGPPQPDVTSSFVGVDDVSDGGDSLSASGLDASLAPSLSVSSIARAERMLHKSVPFVNGGRHIAFTKEDVGHIHDGELLRFLEDNSAMFVKYLRRPAAVSSHPPPVEGEENAHVPVETLPTSAGREEMEEKMQEIETDIATFITAFDTDGHTYRICVDDDGRLLVPVADSLDNEDEFNEYDEDVDNNADHDGYKNATEIDNDDNGDDVDVEAKDPVLDGEEPSGSLPPPLPGPPRLGRRVRLRLAAPVKPLVEPVLKPTLKPKAENKPETKPKRKGRRTVKKKEQIPVRLLGLTEEEDHRVDALLSGGWDKEPSPFAFSVAAKDRLAEIDERLRCLREMRGASKTDYGESEDDNDASAQEKDTTIESATGNDDARDTNGDVSAGPRSSAKSPSVQDSVVRPTARSLGDAYMREVRARRQYESRMRDVNTRLERLHREAELCALRPAEDAPRIAGRPAPRWVSDALPPPPSEADIAALLAAAEAETAAATARGYGQPYVPPRGDGAIGYLREQLRGAMGRVAALLPDEEMDESGS